MGRKRKRCRVRGERGVVKYRRREVGWEKVRDRQRRGDIRCKIIISNP
jgi:hypothetical protein